MTEFVKITSQALTAHINPQGAELWSLADNRGRQLMTNGDAAYWSGRAPILFPVVGALAEDSYRYRGRRFRMLKHGFARRSLFEIIDHRSSSAWFRLQANETTYPQFPFEFRLDLRFTLSGATLSMTASVSNMGEKPMPFSLGFHPAFAWPLPYGGRVQDHRIVFAEDEPALIRRLDLNSGLLAALPSASPVNGRVYKPKYSDFQADALIWDTLTSRSLEFGVPGRPRLQIGFEGLPILGIWQKPGAGFLCIEPWAGLADPVGFEGEFDEKPGIQVLTAGGVQTFRCEISLIK